jgi:hypothetical protein
MEVQDVYEKFSRSYLIIHFDSLFAATCLKDEAVLLVARNANRLLNEAKEILKKEFDIDMDAERDLETYSGGEQVIIACVSIFLSLKILHKCDCHVLLVNSLESLNTKKMRTLLACLNKIMDGINYAVFILRYQSLDLMTSEPEVKPEVITLEA